MTEHRGEIVLAEERSRNARQQFMATLGTVKNRLSPGTIAQDAMESAADGAKSLVRRRPLAVAAAAGALGLLLSRRLIRRKVAQRKIEHATGDDTSR
ncbi:hypothetical protein [Stakelama tenebrarum]|uniref:DUF3618 domain-containing protein n=1 Tax=Stakelama tenebrarum TaxID=2711215 RepID=A0A6G6Y6D0_9SPHN|nr:hypothetical protein [Sphingosinithalassobacter tenebrarum]QIG80470.1 hypothetical protein G5C33_12225 [Sphingosinithalassobacter tenebrarum]